jgi:eukaryotic-like serine/threonine-protein kinase
VDAAASGSGSSFDLEVSMDDAIRRGEVVGDKYRIEGVLGTGAMGIVYAAHHLLLDERVALKVLRTELVAYPDAVKRFTREARAAAKIKNEHVTRVFDVGELSDGTPYIVMESLDGEDLARWLRTRGALGLEDAIAFVLQACEALAEAHVLGIVHRDLKPSNLFCSRRPDGTLSIKVLDFGISKVAALATSMSGGVVRGGQGTLGSPSYMSPEQMSSQDVDHRADIWALGVILFELLTDAVPFVAKTLPELCIKVTAESPRSICALRPEIPEEIEATIAKCLAKNPEDRFENLAEFAGSLFPLAGKSARASIERIVQVSRRARTQEAVRAASETPPSQRPADRATIRPLGATVPPRDEKKSGKLTWVGLGGAAAVALGVVFFWTRPTGNGHEVSSGESPAAKAAAQSAPTPKATPVPQGPENLPQAEEPSHRESSLDDVTFEHASPKTAGRSTPPAGANTAKKTGGAAENKAEHRRLFEQDSAARDSARPPAKMLPDLSPTAPGLERRRPNPKNQPREIDESDPYAR